MRFVFNTVFAAFFSSFLFLHACNVKKAQPQNEYAKEKINRHIYQDFNDYWYTGEAEINTYNLEQSRYGEIRNGDAVLIFVTEDFSLEKQVKLDNPDNTPADKVSVLKLNFLKKFKTGIYDYSLMESAFTPIALEKYPNTLKTTFSAQDWCGQTFLQLNLTSTKFKAQQFSYFESEGDFTNEFEIAFLEDEIWNRLRIDPKSIPTGNQKMLPAASYSRLLHKPLMLAEALVEIKELSNSVSSLTITYPQLKRFVKIDFETKFPFKILGWEEKNGDERPTRAILSKTVKIDYWTKNRNENSGLRDSLDLMF